MTQFQRAITRQPAVDSRVSSAIGWLVIFLVFLVYLFTLSPTVGLIDSGELATGCYLLNILHPTGYPLFTILGRLATLVPLGTVVNRLAVTSALFSTAGVGLFLLLCRQLGFRPLTSAGVGALLALSPSIWSVSTDVEVYSLTFLLTISVWLAAVGCRLSLFGYIAGLTLTNHMSGLTAVLGAMLAMIGQHRRHFIRYLTKIGLFFLLGLSLYLFLLLRARCEPLFCWGNPVNLERFWWHITGRQYQVWMFSLPFSEVIKNGVKGLSLLARTFGYVLIPFILIGFFQLFREKRGLTVGLTLTILLAFIYAINYSIPDIEAYYIPALVPLAIFCVAGLDWLSTLGIDLKSKIKNIGFWILAVVVVMVFFLNYPVQNRRSDWVAYDQAMNTLISADSNAIIITDWWDTYAPIFYLQVIEKVRPDVCIIDKELIRRSWYFNYLAKAYPWLIERSKSEMENYLIHLNRFEHNIPYNPVAIQESYINLLRSFILFSPERPAYTTFPADANPDAWQLLSGFNLVPVGVLLQIRTDTVIPDFNYSRLRVRLPRFHLDERHRVNLDRYRFFVQRRIDLLKAKGREKEAQDIANWYQETFPRRQ